MKILRPIFIAALFLALAVGLGGNLFSQARVSKPRPVPQPSSSDSSESRVHTNRLASEKSPYLLQHAHNPVDWYPWGEDAFAKARTENKPILLSVGYSTCHWCHVMARESFENPEIAKIMNENFVCIKVDREERPDVDRVYMTFVQASTGSGGWPMTVWLTPDLKPFFGGTYFPPSDRDSLTGFPKVLRQIADTWKADREKLVTQAGRIIAALQKQAASEVGQTNAIDQTILRAGYDEAADRFDSDEGGFAERPKFPRPVVLNFLFRVMARDGKASQTGKHALEMSSLTLKKMAAGGIHDHLGGGFHRYSVDARWHVPHFEKMLYDQAQLAMAYLDAFQITRDPVYERVARDILTYVRRDLADPQGGFYSGEDADSLFELGKPDHGEGVFYVWTKAEVNRALGKPADALFDYYYGVETKGNVANDPRDEFGGKNILAQRHSLPETAKQFKLPEEQVQRILAESRQKLFAVRERRSRPHRDDKIITAWNGMMISAFARAHQVLGDGEYLKAATLAAAFLRDKLYRGESGPLIRSYRKGASKVNGFADDYAYLIQGLLDLYEAGFDVQWLRWAAQLQEQQDSLFWDKQNGGYYSVSGSDPTILLRMKEDYDGAEPSPNSVAALNLLRLAQMTGREPWQRQAERILGRFGGTLRQSPHSLPQMMVALDAYLRKPRQIVVAGKPDAADTRAIVREVHRHFIPNKILLLADGGAGQEFLSQTQEFFRTVKMVGGKATAYICENYVCKLPTNDPMKVRELLVGEK